MMQVVDRAGSEVGQGCLSIRDLEAMGGPAGGLGHPPRVIIDLSSGGQPKARLAVDVTVKVRPSI